MFAILFSLVLAAGPDIHHNHSNVIDGCTEYIKVTPKLLEVKGFYLEPGKHVCIAVDTVFIFGEQLKITVSHYNNQTDQMNKPRSKSYFVGVSTWCKDRDDRCEIEYYTLVKVESKLKESQTIAIVGAERSIITKDKNLRVFNHSQIYFTTCRHFSLLAEYEVMRYWNKTDNTYWTSYYYLQTALITLDQPVEVYYRNNEERIRALSINGTVNNSEPLILMDHNSTDKKGTLTGTNNVLISLNLTDESLLSQKEFSYSARTYLRWSVEKRNKIVKDIYGRIKNDNRILYFGNLVGIYELEIWVFILFIVIIFLLVVSIIIACFVCIYRRLTNASTSDFQTESEPKSKSDITLSETSEASSSGDSI